MSDKTIEITIKDKDRGGKYVELERRVLTNYNDGRGDHWIDEFGREWVRK